MHQSTNLDSGDSSPTGWDYGASREKSQSWLLGLGGPSRAAATPHASEFAAQCAAQCKPLLALPTLCRRDDGPAGCAESSPWCCRVAGRRCCPHPPRCLPCDHSDLAHTRPLSRFAQPLELLVGWEHARLEGSVSSSRLAAGGVTTPNPAGTAPAL